MLVRIGNTLFRWRNTLFPVIFVLLFAGVPPVPAGTLRTALEVAGLLLVLGGTVVRVAVAGAHYIKRAGAANHIHAGTLHTDGVFSALRNPLYLGNILLGAGFLALLGNPGTWLPGALVVFLAYRAIVAAEEDYLARTFGDAYARYCARVPRWLPRPGVLRVALSDAAFSWRSAVSMEYSTLGATLLALIALHMRNSHGHADFIPLIDAACAALVVAFVAALRMAKKAGAFH